MDIKNINTFIRVAELKSFTKVALESNYAQSTVTAQIQQLERELGYMLFDRIGKTVSLTSLGNEFLKYAYSISAELERAMSLNNDSNEVSGDLRVGVIESLLFHSLKDILPEYKKRYANVNVKIKMGQTTELIEMLKQNLLDLVYISAEINTDNDLLCILQKEEELLFLSSPAHPLASKPKIPTADLFDYDFVVTEQSGVCYGRLKQLAAQSAKTLNTIVEVDSTLIIADMIEKNLGLGFLPGYSVADEIQSGDICALDVDLSKQLYYRQILCHKNKWQSPIIKSFTKEIEEYVFI